MIAWNEIIKEAVVAFTFMLCSCKKPRRHGLFIDEERNLKSLSIYSIAGGVALIWELSSSGVIETKEAKMMETQLKLASLPKEPPQWTEKEIEEAVQKLLLLSPREREREIAQGTFHSLHSQGDAKRIRKKLKEVLATHSS